MLRFLSFFTWLRRRKEDRLEGERLNKHIAALKADSLNDARTRYWQAVSNDAASDHIQQLEDNYFKEKNSYSHWMQGDLRSDITKRGIIMRPEHYDTKLLDSDKPTLNRLGENYARRMITSSQLEQAKNWVAIFTPILSAIIAILGLLVALKKGK